MKRELGSPLPLRVVCPGQQSPMNHEHLLILRRGILYAPPVHNYNYYQYSAAARKRMKDVVVAVKHSSLVVAMVA